MRIKKLKYTEIRYKRNLFRLKKVKTIKISHKLKTLRYGTILTKQNPVRISSFSVRSTDPAHLKKYFLYSEYVFKQSRKKFEEIIFVGFLIYFSFVCEKYPRE